MGIPVSGKNLFPSNIAGLPTWYTIRASKDGYVARKKEIDLLIAMNPETSQEDMLSLPPGAAAIYEESANLQQFRDDVACYPVPFDKLTAAVCPEAKLRKLVKNMIYVGVAAQLLKMDMAAVEAALRKQFAKKVKAADLNWAAVQAGYEYAAANFTKHDPFVLERDERDRGQDHHRWQRRRRAGLHLCRLHGGRCGIRLRRRRRVVENFIDYAKRYRVEDDGKATFAVVQAEDELAAIGAVLGAGWAGARAMTATSGPGISLMAEFAGLGYYAELPGVIFDVQRTGPSTGMPTRNQQGDLLSVAFLSHGDTKHVMLIPGSVKECYEMAQAAFDLTEQLQTPVFVMSDLDLGMNNWMSEPFAYPDKPLNRGKVLSAEDLNEARRIRPLQGCRRRRRRLSHAARHRPSRWRPTSRAAPATTRRRSTPSGPTTTSTTWSGWPRSSRPRARSFRGPRSCRPANRRSASSPSAPPTSRRARAAIS